MSKNQKQGQTKSRSKSAEKQCIMTKRKYLTNQIEQPNYEWESQSSDSYNEYSDYSIKSPTFMDKIIEFKYLLTLPQPKKQNVEFQQDQLYRYGTQTCPGSQISFDFEKPSKFIKISQDLKNQYLEKYGNEFCQDQLQFIAMFYQLSKYNLQRIPITQCSPIIAYYLFSILALYKQNKERYYLDHIFEPVYELFLGLESCHQLTIFFSPLKERFFYCASVDYIFEQLKSLESLLQKSGKTFNYQLAIDDFLMYQQLYQQNKQSIDEQLKENKYGQSNLCLGYIRYVFYDVTQERYFNIRIPIGQFDQNTVINVESFKLITKDTLKYYNLLELTNLNSNETNSEILLLLWIVENQDYFVHELCQQLENQNSVQQQTKSQLFLNEIYIEITTEYRICQTCVDKFCKFPTKLITDDIINKINSNTFTFQVNDQFKLIIVSQYLCEYEYIFDNKGLSLYCKGQYYLDSFERNKDIYYYETKYVGLMTFDFLEKRYIETSNQLFTQRIDCIKPKNTFFLGQLINTSKSKQRSAIQQLYTEDQQNTFLNTDIYSLLTETISQVTWINQQKPYQYKEGNIQQKQTLITYQLMQIIINKQIYHQELIHLISPNFQKLLLIYFLIPSMQEELFGYLLDLDSKKQIEERVALKLFFNFHKKILKTNKNLFDIGILNTKLVFQDYYFMIYSNQSTEQINYEQPNLKMNFGLVKLNLNLQDQNSIVSQELMDVQMDSINNNFFEELQNQYLFRQQQLTQNSIIITKIELLVVTMQQLPKEYKIWLEQKLNLGIDIEYHYQYFRKLLPISSDVYKNEEQCVPFNAKILETRYSQENAEFQVPLINMDANISAQLKYFDYDYFQQNQQMVMEVQ